MLQGTMTLSTYFTKLKALWDELEAYDTLYTCNQREIYDQREEDKLMQLLMGLNESYKRWDLWLHYLMWGKPIHYLVQEEM